MLTYRTKRKPEMFGAHVARALTTTTATGFVRRKGEDPFQTRSVCDAAKEFLRTHYESKTLRVSRLVRRKTSQ